jgi:dynein intermediate chain
VTKAIFNPFQPNTVIAATQSGCIVQWNILQKTTPVQKSTLAADGHTHPIHSLAIIGTSNAHNIVSVSVDGKLCVWHFGELGSPKISFKLFPPPAKQEDNLIDVNTIDFPEEETDKFFIGSADCKVYQAHLHQSNNSRQDGVTHNWRTFTGHQAPVTKLALHPGKSQYDSNRMPAGLSDMSELMLTASMDWTIKLWYPKNEASNQPIFTFESSQEYVYDVQWSPVHPAVFASVDGDGIIDIWDINRDKEGPVAHKKAFESTSSNSVYKDQDENRPISCLKWSLDGRKIAIGDAEGFVSIWNVDKELYSPKLSDFEEIEALMQEHSTEETQKRQSKNVHELD